MRNVSLFSYLPGSSFMPQQLFLFAGLAVCIAIGVPVFLSLAAVSFATIFLYSDIPLYILPQRMFAGVEGFTLLAIPFFMFASNIMSRGGLTEKLIRIAQTLVGHVPGGLAICTVLTSLFFAAITGSSASSVVAVGTIMYPALVSAGYKEDFSLGIVACSALLGMIIPPSSAMIVYSSVSGTSIGALFMAGIGAGLVFAGNYMLYSYFYAKRHQIHTSKKASQKEIKAAIKDGAWGLGFPFIILGGIYSGAFTPTESAAVAVGYALLVTTLVNKKLQLKDVWNIGIETARVTARILIMVAAATLFSWVLTIQGITQEITSAVTMLEMPRWAVLLTANLLMLFAGMFLDIFSNILILSPLLLPVVETVGVSELHYGIVTVVNSDLGNITPPFGLIIFIASGAFNKSYLETLRAILPFFLLAIVSLAIITYLPAVSLYLPGLLY